MEYQIINTTVLGMLVKKINELIADGWIPQGGCAHTRFMGWT